MAIILTDNRIVRNEADSTTDWVGTETLFTTDPTPVEASGQLGESVGAVEFDAYHDSGSTDYSNHVIYCWSFSRLALGNTNDTNGGLMVYVGDATNAGGFKVAGADKSPFRHDDGPVGWTCAALDTTNLPASPVDAAGSAASVNFTTISRVGIRVNSLVAAPGMNPTFHMDIIRILDAGANDGCALTITGGTTADPGTFLDIAVEDRQTGSLQAHGVVRELGTGVYGVQGPLRFGNVAGSDTSSFIDKSVSVIFEDRGFRNDLYKMVIRDNGTGTTTFQLGDKVGSGTSATGNNGVVLTAPLGVGALFDSKTDTNVTDVFVYGSTFNGFTNGIFTGTGGQEFSGNTFSGCGTIIPSGSLFYNNTVTSSPDSSSLYWNVNLNTTGYINGCTFIGSGSTNHAIEYGPTAPVSTSLTDVNFTSYGASDTSASAIFNNSGKDLYIEILGSGNTPTVRNAGGLNTTVVAGLRTLTLTQIESGSEVAIVSQSNNRELIAAEESVANPPGTFTYTRQYAGVDRTVDIIIHALDYEYFIETFTLKDEDQSFQVSQIPDRNYDNPD